MSVNVIDTIKPKNGGSFPVVEAVDVAVSGGTRLNTALDAKANTSDLATVAASVAGKADKSDISTIRTEIALKAAQSSLDATNVIVASKAAQSSLDALSVIVSNKADKHDYDGIYAALDTKASKDFVNETKAELAETDANLQNQINQIEISASAEAVVAPEVAAARVGADSTNYETLKQRLDAEATFFDKGLNVSAEQITDNTELASLNDCEINRIYRLNVLEADTPPANSPSRQGIVYNISFKDDANTTIQYFISKDGKINKYRTNWNGTWSGWFDLRDTLRESDIDQITDNTIITSLNDCENNIIYRLNVPDGNTAPANSPAKQGIVYSVGWNKDGVETKTQYFISANGTKYKYRVKWNQTWSSWSDLKDSVRDNDGDQIIDTSVIASLNELENNRIYRLNIPPNSTDIPANAPAKQGVVYSIGWNKDGVETKIQYFVSETGKIAKYRINWNQSWSTWKDIFESYEANFDFGFIQNFAVIGDSYASGEIYVDDGQGGYTQQDYYNKSWGQILARKYGATCINMSKGGLTTRTWLTDSKGLALLQSSDAQELYLCALGHNDEGYSTYGLSYLGTEADMTTKADTFYGNYARIIEAIQTKAPNAKIVLMTVAYLYNSTEDAFNEAIKNIAAHYEIPCMDIKDDSFYASTSIYHTGKKWNHPTAAIYAGMAKTNAKLFGKCIENNYNYFADFV